MNTICSKLFTLYLTFLVCQTVSNIGHLSKTIDKGNHRVLAHEQLGERRRIGQDVPAVHTDGAEESRSGSGYKSEH